MLLSDRFTSMTCIKVYYNGSYNMLPSVFLNIPTSFHLILVSKTCWVLESNLYCLVISCTQVLIFCYCYPRPQYTIPLLIFYHSWKEHVEVGEVAKFGGEML